MYNTDDVVLTVDKIKNGHVITSSIITSVTQIYEHIIYTVDDIWMITNLKDFAPDTNIDITEDNIIKEVTEDYSKEDFEKEYPEYLI